MKKFLSAAVAAFFVLFSTQVFSQNSLNMSSLTPEQREELRIRAEEMERGAPVKQTQQTLSQIKEWAGFGTAIGQGIVSTARELGVAANDFAKTDLGKTVVNLIIWKYFGRDIMGIILALIGLLVLIPIGIQLVRTGLNSRYNFEYAPYPMLWGAFTIKRLVKKEPNSDNLSDAETIRTFIGAVAMVIGAGALFINIIPAR